MVNLSAFIANHARRTPDREAVFYAGQSTSYRELHRSVLHLAGYLAECGIGRDNIVAMCMKNSLAFLQLQFAISHLGAVSLPINYRLAAAEVDYIVGHAGADLLFADEEFSAELATLPVHRYLVEAEQHDVMAFCSSAPIADCTPCESQDLMRLMYTSGTTDRPKGVMLSYENFYWKSMDVAIDLDMTREVRLLTVGPLYHAGGLDLPGIAALWVGGMMHVHRDFDARAAIQSIASSRLTGAWMAPTMTNAILALSDVREHDVSSLQWLIGGGERTPEQRIREFSEVFASARYIDAYGMTETTSGDTLMEAGREIEKIGSVGRALAHVAIRIVDDDGQPLSAGVEGEIVLRGPKVTRGYWRDPEKTAASFFGDWFRSGDVGYLDEEGFLFLTDRKKDMILSGGENIASSEVERVIYDLPQVHEAAVVGVPDEKWGERPIAVVSLKAGEQLDYQQLERHCRQHLAGFKVPRDLILRDALPRNPSGKVLKRVLREELVASA